MGKLLWIAVVASIVLVSGIAADGHAHSWYPQECCHDDDCAPVVKIEMLSDGFFRVTTENGRSAIFHKFLPKEPSQDKRMHACIYAGEPLCLFVPPGM